MKATEQITAKITEMQGETGAAAEAVRGFAETIHQIDELMSVVASAVEEQGAATEEISRSVEGAANGNVAISNAVKSVAGPQPKAAIFQMVSLTVSVVLRPPMMSLEAM